MIRLFYVPPAAAELTQTSLTSLSLSPLDAARNVIVFNKKNTVFFCSIGNQSKSINELALSDSNGLGSPQAKAKHKQN